MALRWRAYSLNGSTSNLTRRTCRNATGPPRWRAPLSMSPTADGSQTFFAYSIVAVGSACAAKIPTAFGAEAVFGNAVPVPSSFEPSALLVEERLLLRATAEWNADATMRSPHAHTESLFMPQRERGSDSTRTAPIRSTDA